MLILLPPWLEALLRYGGRLVVAGALIWIAWESYVIFAGGSGSSLSRAVSGSMQSARTSQGAAGIKPIPFALVCIPVDHQRRVAKGDPKAKEYEASIQKQLRLLLRALNEPDSNFRRENPGKGFVIVIHKRDASYSAEKIQRGLGSVMTTVPYDYTDKDREQGCPPTSLMQKTHRYYRPEYSNTRYDPQWRSVPTLAQ